MTDNTTPADGDEVIDLALLSDEDLTLQMHDDLYDGMKEEIAEGTTILLDRGWAPDKVLNDALVEGMRIVGIDFRDGILFVPEVLLAANALGFGSIWLTGANAYDEYVRAELGIEPAEYIIGFLYIGTPNIEFPPRPIPEVSTHHTQWE